MSASQAERRGVDSHRPLEERHNREASKAGGDCISPPAFFFPGATGNYGFPPSTPAGWPISWHTFILINRRPNHPPCSADALNVCQDFQHLNPPATRRRTASEPAANRVRTGEQGLFTAER